MTPSKIVKAKQYYINSDRKPIQMEDIYINVNHIKFMTCFKDKHLKHLIRVHMMGDSDQYPITVSKEGFIASENE